ncbi:MAG TPA: thiopurine S-methyltransferase [Geopsychrobacteraceae bacterium]|nr:thiopurine S-methyltransferase [Geopsychrobacteraceae bacterium]
MRSNFWHNRWERNEIGFHQSGINPFLIRFFPTLDLSEGDKVFAPLCGKSRDLLWLIEQGYEVVGIELSEQAVRAFFHENEIEPKVETCGPFLCFRAEHLRLFCGDYFKLTAKVLGPVTAVYDRAALVALPPEMRRDYVRHLADLVVIETAMLVISYTYDQSLMDGPPFAVPQQEMVALFSGLFEVELLVREATGEIPPRFRASGLTEVSEEVYRLVRL